MKLKSLIKNAFYLLDKDKKKKIKKIGIQLAALSIIEVLSVISVMPFLSVISSHQMLENPGGINQAFELVNKYGVNEKEFILLLGVVSFALLITSLIYKAYTYYVVDKFVYTQSHNISLKILNKLVKSDYETIKKASQSEFTKNILSDPAELVSHIYQPIFNLIMNATITTAILSVVVMSSSVEVLAGGSIILGVYYMVFFVLKKRLIDLGDERVKSNIERFKTLGDIIKNLQVIKVKNKEESFIKKFEESSGAYSKVQIKNQLLNKVPGIFIETLIYGALFISVALLLMREGNGNNISELLPLIGLYAISAMKIKPSINAIFVAFSNLRFGQKVLNIIIERVEADKKIKENSVKNNVAKFKELVISGLDFKYEKSKIIFNGLNLKISANEYIGILGHSGCGKSTLIDIIAGLTYVESYKEFLVNGIPINSINQETWRDNIGLVPQEVNLITGNLKTNIAFSHNSEDISLGRVIDCAKSAQLHTFITTELKDGYDTLIGDGGVALSGGQKQRIGIARALYNDPQILILDESTSSLDHKTKNEFLKQIKVLKGKKTIISISHDESSLLDCDRKLRIEKNKIFKI